GIEILAPSAVARVGDYRPTGGVAQLASRGGPMGGARASARGQQLGFAFGAIRKTRYRYGWHIGRIGQQLPDDEPSAGRDTSESNEFLDVVSFSVLLLGSSRHHPDRPGISRILRVPPTNRPANVERNRSWHRSCQPPTRYPAASGPEQPGSSTWYIS